MPSSHTHPKRALTILAILMATTAAHAARPASEGKKLALQAVTLLKKTEPMALDGHGLQGASSGLYYQAFENPLADQLAKWPTNMDPESRTWGDYLYCRDALMDLRSLGMAQVQGNKALSSPPKVAEYRRNRDKCFSALTKSPDQVQ
jgi:hypothetical protein